MMVLTSFYDVQHHSQEYRLVIPDIDICKLKLSPWDEGLIMECEKSSAISDKLLALCEITRNIEGVCESE